MNYRTTQSKTKKKMLHSAAILIVVNLALICGSYGQMENMPSADDVLKMASDAANLPNFNVSALPVEEAKTAFKQKCEKNGGPNAFASAENATKDVEVCVKGLVNVTQLQEEMEPAKKTGDLDTVFKKYCNKSPILQGCVRKFTNSVEPCFTEAERQNIRLMRNITDSLLSFVCYKDGDRIALFIAAGGPECFSSKQSVIQDCVNSTFGSYVPSEGLPSSVGGFEKVPLLLLDTKECTDIDKLQHCIVRELETCSDPTPGNIVDSLFNYIKRVTPCDTLLAKVRADRSFGRVNSASPTIIGVHVVAIALSFLTLGFL